jgi:hypothetical protein
MIGTLTVHRETEASFKKACNELNIHFCCVKEGIDGDTFEVHFDSHSDIYALGQMVGMDSLIGFNK